jgi:hypothetical protein
MVPAEVGTESLASGPRLGLRVTLMKSLGCVVGL